MSSTGSQASYRWREMLALRPAELIKPCEPGLEGGDSAAARLFFASGESDATLRRRMDTLATSIHIMGVGQLWSGREQVLGYIPGNFGRVVYCSPALLTYSRSSLLWATSMGLCGTT